MSDDYPNGAFRRPGSGSTLLERAFEDSLRRKFFENRFEFSSFETSFYSFENSISFLLDFENLQSVGYLREEIHKERESYRNRIRGKFLVIFYN